MKLRIALLALAAAAGVLASVAIAKPPPGHGNPHDAAVSTTGTTSTTSSTTTTTSTRKVLVCHRVGNGHYVLISVSLNSAPAKGTHGDVRASNSTCPGPMLGHGAHTTSTTTKTTTTTSS